MSVAPGKPSVPAVSPSARLRWLDALRGIGAAAVVGEHLLPWVVPWLRPYWFNLGIYGVLVFFLVSGYIIPASLERHGDVRAFWISRAFRLYPLYLLVIGMVLAMAWYLPVRDAVPRDPAAAVAHATMLLDVVGVGGVADTMWTLSYEMVFYLMVTALFVTGAHRRSATSALLFGVAAVVVAALVPAAMLRGAWLAWVSGGVFAAGLACVVSGRFRRTGACALGVMALVLLLLGSRVPWLGVLILAVMFAGTAVHRWERGAGPFWPIALTLALVAVTPLPALQSGWWWSAPRVWITTVALACVTFAAAFALRHRRVPGWLTWLGLVSYSLYLLHHPLLRLYVSLTGDLRWSAWQVQLLMAALFVALILLAAWVTHRLVELPAQRLGHRLARPAIPAGRRRSASPAA
ncbi:acyltransferase family protein [Sphaerisporangium dianthi]|uniref:Acyltransferase family protein n=1 Tax=Sphaerisporangium dianthi TaxID=1436120 RepID=A0ABV9CRA3_9ACTN